MLCVVTGDVGLVPTGTRVGVSGPRGDATAYPWRFWLAGDPTVSAYRPGVVRARHSRPPCGTAGYSVARA